MKQESKRQVRDKSARSKSRHRKNTINNLHEKSFDNLVEKIGDYQIQLTQVIGEGTYGKVYKASKLNSDQQFACKFIKKDRIDDLQIYYKDTKMAQQLENRLITEGQVFILNDHSFNQSQPNVNISQDCIKQKKIKKASILLSKLLKKQGFLSQQMALKYFKQIIQGIKFIYDKHAFHRDLKPQNLLIKGETIKISDFGFVKIFDQIDKKCKSRKNRFQTQSKVGTFRYMSPDILALLSNEIKQFKKSQNTDILNQQPIQDKGSIKSIEGQKKYDPEKSDVWSLGIILYKMLYGKQPYDGKSFEQMIMKIQSQKLNFPAIIQFPPGKTIKLNISKNLMKLIKKMLTPDQTQRIDFMKLYKKFNEFFEQRQKQKIRSGIEQNYQQNNSKSTKTQEISRNKKQRLLNVYNKIMIRIYKDLSTFATLRQIGIQNYSQYSYKIMTLLHEKRTAYLEEEEIQEDASRRNQNDITPISEPIKQQISHYHNVFYQQIKMLSDLKPQQTLLSLLLLVYEKLSKYEDYQMLIKEVQLFLLFLMQFLCLQLGIIKEDYICATEDKAESLKTKSIENFKNDVMKLIQDRTQGKRSKSTSKQKTHSKDKSDDQQKTTKRKKHEKNEDKQVSSDKTRTKSSKKRQTKQKE